MRWNGAKAFVGIALGVLLSACVHRGSVADYPGQWSKRTAVAKARCPDLAGRYRDLGELAPDTPQQLCHRGRRRDYRASWECEASLSRNIADIASGEWVELRQPDADTLLIVSSDPTRDIKVMHRSRGDFSCSVEGLERRLHASSMSLGNSDAEEPVGLAAFNGVGTLYGAAFGSGGVRTLTRSFRMAEDGSLTMDVSVAESDLALLIPLRIRNETFVRWARLDAPGSAEHSLDAPFRHFARFESLNGFVYRVQVTMVDDTGVAPERQGEPVALAPGRRWLQITMIDHSLTALVDFPTEYAFEMDAVAGHTYRLAQRPERCLAGGKVQAALAAHEVRRAALTVIDEAAGTAARQLQVEGRCIAGPTILCEPGHPERGADGMTCVGLPASPHGFWGRDGT